MAASGAAPTGGVAGLLTPPAPGKARGSAMTTRTYLRPRSAVDRAAALLTYKWETSRQVADRTGWLDSNPGQRLSAAYARRLCERRENPPGARVYEYRLTPPDATAEDADA